MVRALLCSPRIPTSVPSICRRTRTRTSQRVPGHTTTHFPHAPSSALRFCLRVRLPARLSVQRRNYSRYTDVLGVKSPASQGTNGGMSLLGTVASVGAGLAMGVGACAATIADSRARALGFVDPVVWCVKILRRGLNRKVFLGKLLLYRCTQICPFRRCRPVFVLRQMPGQELSGTARQPRVDQAVKLDSFPSRCLGWDAATELVYPPVEISAPNSPTAGPPRLQYVLVFSSCLREIPGV